MKVLLFRIVATVAISVCTLSAQDLSGTWQGTLHAGRDLRTVLKISKGDGGALKGTFYSIDQPGPGIPAGPISLLGTTVKFAIPAIGGTYEGKLANTDGTTITGFWSQGGPTPLALDLTLANDKTAWTIPEPPPPPVPMAANADPAFEVATIKPSPPEQPGKTIRLNGRNFSTTNYTLNDLITFAYGLHERQITGGPGFMETDKYDLSAIPDKPGAPNVPQLKLMVQKLLADRFKLAFHRDKKELSVFAITVAKTGSKLKPSVDNSNGVPSFAVGLGNLRVANSTIGDFAELMQTSVLDRPVANQTELTGRFNFTLKWTPDETQFGGRGGQAPPPANGATAAPSLFTAMQEQLGLKIEATKAPIDVLVIDRVEKPSEN